MLDGVQIIEFFATLGVGIALILLALFFYFRWRQCFYPGRPSAFNSIASLLRTGLGGSEKNLLYGILLLVSIYGIGISGSLLTDHMSDSSDNQKNIVFKRLKQWSRLEEEEWLMQLVLLYQLPSEGRQGDTLWRLTGLGRRIFTDTVITGAANRSLLLSERFFDTEAERLEPDYTVTRLQRANKETRESFLMFCKEIYFTAKNRLYADKGNIHSELLDLQNATDFVRSLCLLSVAGFIFLILTIFLSWEVALVRYHRKGTISVTRFGDVWPTLRSDVLSLVFFFVVWVCSRESYQVAEQNYNKRVFGYFSTSTFTTEKKS